MLIIQIAIGVFLGFLILLYLPQILGWLILLVLGGIMLIPIIIAIAFFKEILPFLVVALVLAFGYAGSMGLYLLISFIYPKIKETKTTRQTWFVTFAVLNLFLVVGIYDTLPFSHALHEWSSENGLEDVAELAFIGFLFMWAWVPVSLRYYLKRKKITLDYFCKTEPKD